MVTYTCPGDTSELSHTSFSSCTVYTCIGEKVYTSVTGKNTFFSSKQIFLKNKDLRTIVAAAQVHSVPDTSSCCRSGPPCQFSASSSLGPVCTKKDYH